ncbi:MAG: hypothetical protein R3F56_01975 [Planctomycetota bacterium]
MSVRRLVVGYVGQLYRSGGGSLALEHARVGEPPQPSRHEAYRD